MISSCQHTFPATTSQRGGCGLRKYYAEALKHYKSLEIMETAKYKSLKSQYNSGVMEAGMLEYLLR